jgi:hypothetical protein
LASIRTKKQAENLEKKPIVKDPIRSSNATTMPDVQQPLQSLPFPDIHPQQILNTSFHSWYPVFRSVTPKARVIPLTAAFIDYLRADGIILPPEHRASTTNNDPEDSGYDDEDNPDDESYDPSERWPEIHAQIAATIKELGGKVVPKLNWSAPKDATWISTTNDMECRTPNDIYLLLKSSDFVTHDLEYPFDGCVMPTDGSAPPEVHYHLVLRKSFNLNPALEFRCFVRGGQLIAISQREMNYFEFLAELRPKFKRLIQDFLLEKIISRPAVQGEDQGSNQDKVSTASRRFPDENFVADVYVPPPYEKVWLIDINPWAPRTDPILFSWLELLTMDVSASQIEDEMADEDSDGEDDDDDESADEHDDDGRDHVVRIRIPPESLSQNGSKAAQEEQSSQAHAVDLVPTTTKHDQEDDAAVEILPFDPPFRLVNRDDPEAYQFSATKYSAHKLPKEIVEASLAPGGMRDIMEEMKRALDGQIADSEDEDDG